MAHDLDRPAQVLLDPRLSCAGVALVNPDVSHARELLVHPSQE